MKKLSLLLGAALLALGGVGSQAQIQRLTLEQITTRSDHAIVGTIVGRKVVDLGNEIDGFGLYYTILTIEGDSLHDGRKMTVDVVKRGGWIDKEAGIGSWDSEAPSDEETALGKRIVAYYFWTNIAQNHGANLLYASHGALFRTVEGPTGTVVMGRGDGYAIHKNRSLANLRKATVAILEENAKKQLDQGQDR